MHMCSVFNNTIEGEETVHMSPFFKILRPKSNDRHVAGEIAKCSSLRYVF